MKLSTKTRYGLRALLDLSLLTNNETRSISQLAKAQDISEQYLESIFAMLRKAGIVSSVRGYQGGYSLAKSKQEITLYDILNALEESLTIVENPDPDDPIRKVLNDILWTKIDANICRYLKTLSLDQLTSDHFDDLMYYI